MIDEEFAIDAVEADGVLRISVSGELDLATESELANAVRQRLEHATARRLVLDLRNVVFIDSSGLRGVLHCRSAAEAHGLPFSLAVADGVVTRLFDVAGVCDWFAYE